MTLNNIQLDLDLHTTDGATIEAWVENCLRSQNDDAIIQAISGMHKIETNRVADAVAQQFNDFVDRIGKREFHVRMISIPVSITADSQIDESVFRIRDVSRYLQTFYQHGLVNKDNGGIVLLNRLIDHTELENTPLSDLYALRQTIFDSAKQGKLRTPNLGRFGEGTPDTSWLFIPNGFYTMRHLVGVVFWDGSRSTPPIIEGKGDVDNWMATTINAMLMDIVSQDGGEIEVSILPPAPLLDAIFAATMTMMGRVIGALTEESQSQVGDSAAKIILGCDQNMPGRNQVKVAMVSKENPDHITAAITVRLSIMESIQTAMVLQFLSETLLANGVEVMSNEYYSGAIPEEGSPSLLQ